MAYYLVVAKPNPDRLSVLLRNLQQKAYFTMRPFGTSLTYSLEHARLRDDGYAVWEEDYCTPPLAQERAAALDEFFDELGVTVVERGEGWARIEELPRLFPQLSTQSPDLTLERRYSPRHTGLNPRVVLDAR